MSKIEVNTVAPQCGTTLTLGESGDTVTLGTGASQSGFGRTGTVDWQTGSIKTSTFTAANGEGYFANTSGGAFVMNLPAGTAGNIVSVVDYTNTFQTNALTVTPNGSQKLGGVASSASLNTEGQSVTFVYVDDTEGWKNVQDSTSNAIGNAFLVASGGTETTCGNDKIHTFTGPGTFTVASTAICAAQNIVSHMVIAGGGSGGRYGGAGGGAGGYRELKNPVTPYTASPLDGYPSSPNRVTVTATGFPITVGAGGSVPGPCGSNGQQGGSGSTSIFSTITSAGGGGGGGRTTGTLPQPVANGANGGSGGGGSWCAPGTGSFSVGGSGNTPPTTPAQGTDGSRGQHNGPTHSVPGGGGGAGGAAPISGPGGGGPAGYGTANGGVGTTSSINGTPTARAGGGGGGSSYGGCGGTGGGGDGQKSGRDATAGTTNTGGGGGGGPDSAPGPGAGGSGIVIIRYKFQ